MGGAAFLEKMIWLIIIIIILLNKIKYYNLKYITIKLSI